MCVQRRTIMTNPIGHGGARPGAGRHKGGRNHGISMAVVRDEIAKALGMPFEQAYAQVCLNVFQNQKNDPKNKSAMIFFNTAAKLLFQPLVQSIEIEKSPQDMSDDELREAAIANILSNPELVEELKKHL